MEQRRRRLAGVNISPRFYQGESSTGRAGREYITISDSDDEQGGGVSGIRPTHANGEGSRRAYISPPPPNPDPHVPPVPDTSWGPFQILPTQGRGTGRFPVMPGGFPIRQISPEINVRNRPFDFERNLQPPPEQPAREFPHMMRGTPARRHEHIQLHRHIAQLHNEHHRIQHARHEQQHQPRLIHLPAGPNNNTPGQRFGGALLSHVARPRGGRGGPPHHFPQTHGNLLQRLGRGYLEEGRWQAIFGGEYDDFHTPLGEIIDPPARAPDYLAAYTHPEKLPVGFSADFAPPPVITLADDSESNQPETREESTSILACARCLDPLITGGAKETLTRVFGLRCGHMLDEKCVNELMLPPPPPIEIDEPDFDLTAEKNASSSWKGKGKAREEDPFAEPTRRYDLRHTHAAPPPPFSVVIGPTAVDEPMHSEPVGAGRGGRGRGRGRGARGRGRGRGGRQGVEVPKIVEDFRHWNCPVSSCGEKQKAIKVKGVWKHDKEGGAIALFV
ncbi:hypothetical protein SISSUDRAFT_1033103 [Sistotremastrum suecicum HHB10207 ss-3]|uniref:Uncharacterized protein n=1 Tax=Sistotremastrum suecicum HHB10207 ss-3 TaxID=1314776 RepID=A0A166DSH5_9AGAM|nr:hypothetical protein SISSUDRAFT_1033103 [Sistotremastrum suecicum HHB10207 ss-3]